MKDLSVELGKVLSSVRIMLINLLRLLIIDVALGDKFEDYISEYGKVIDRISSLNLEETADAVDRQIKEAYKSKL